MVSKFGRAVVTGGAGFLGSRVCRRLLEQGTAVVCLDNFLTGGRAEAKRYAETLTTAYGRAGHADTAIARIFDSYGPGMRPDDGRMVGAFMCQALRGEPLTVPGDGTQIRSLCHADDTVRGLLLLAASDLREPVNIGNPDEATVRQIAVRIVSLAGSASPLSYVPRAQDDPMSVMPDITLARTALGFEPSIGWHQGLAETIAWLRRVLPAPAVVTPEHGPTAVTPKYGFAAVQPEHRPPAVQPERGPAAVTSMARRAQRLLRETSRAAAAW